MHTPSVLRHICTLLVLQVVAAYAFAQPAITGSADPDHQTGIMIAGELWDSILPLNCGPSYVENGSDIIRQIRVGNFDRQWSTPTHMWPGGWPYGAFWNKAIEVTVWDPDSSFNPPLVNGSANPSYVAGAGHYAHAAYPNRGLGRSVPGAGDPARDYAHATSWVDPAVRHHAVYQAAHPTTVGLDIALKVHQYTLNWNNFNDFIIIDLTLTNTGVVDMNADGIPERTGHVIEGVCANMHGEYFCYYRLNEAAGRGSAMYAERGVGFVTSADTAGYPWAFHAAFPGETVKWLGDMGIVGPERYAADVWSAWAWLGARDSSGRDFSTRFGTPAVGHGVERGRYVSDGVGKGFTIGIADPRETFIGSMGTFFVDGGRSRDRQRFDLHADENLFEPGSTPGDLRTFRLKPPADRGTSAGDLKTTNEFAVLPHERSWTKGYTAINNFDGDSFSGIGPFTLGVGERVTLTLVVAGGYRFQGVANAIATARWVYEHTGTDHALPFSYPAVPEMRVEGTFDRSLRIRWDARAETHPDFAGYKIYRASRGSPVDWLTSGTRGLDNYWRNGTPGPTPDSLLVPMNPDFTASASVAGRRGEAGSWGPYSLVAVIPAGEIARFTDAGDPVFSRTWEDRTVAVGSTYWYYVAAYTDGAVSLGNDYVSYSNVPATDRLETSNVNRNGASGLWAGTYPFATASTLFPKDAGGRKDIGTGFMVRSALATPADLLSGKARIAVTPNPYKRRADFDDATRPSEHRIMFLNLPDGARITILDVSGQIVQQLTFTSSDGMQGGMFWDLVSRAGVDVASGLYVFVAEYPGGQQVGYFSIMR